LGEAPDVRAALVDPGIPASHHPAHAAALLGLAATDVIRPRPLDAMAEDNIA
jgi:mycofactocin biosynthesis protein MftB